MLTGRPRPKTLPAVLVAIAALAACGGGGTVLAPPPAAVRYAAIGASDAVGYGASKPCTAAVPPAGPADPTCLGLSGTGYVPLLARRLASAGAAVTLDDLGYSGAVLGPDIRATVDAYGLAGSATPCVPALTYPADFLTAELPHVPPNATVVTIFAGGNDTIGLINAVGCGAGGPTLPQQLAYLQREIAAFRTDLATLIAGVHRTAPAAEIAIATLPNFALIPVGLAQTAAIRQGLAYLSTQFDRTVIEPLAAAEGVRLVDLLCDPASYTAANFSSDGFHPDDAGYALIAQRFYAELSPATAVVQPVQPPPACSFAAAQSTLRTRLAGGVRRR